jgi:hypothetical protein
MVVGCMDMISQQISLEMAQRLKNSMDLAWLIDFLNPKVPQTLGGNSQGFNLS